MDEQPGVRSQPLVLPLKALLLATLLPAGAVPGGPGGASPATTAAPGFSSDTTHRDTTPEAALPDPGPAAGPGQLGRRLRRLLDDPSLARAHVGLVVQVAESGHVLFERAPHRRFVPASNAKLVTAAAALHELGPGHRWETRLAASGPIRGDTLGGDLWVVGGGDPALTRADLGTLARRLREAGVRHVDGDLVGDGRRFPPPQWGAGWTWGDTYAGWGAGVSALRLHPGRIRASLVPGDAPGDSTRLVLRRNGPLPAIRNRARTAPPGSDARLDFVPDPPREPVALQGWIPSDADSVDLYLAPEHPTSHLLRVLEDRLREAGVSVAGTARRARRNEEPPGEGWSTTLVSDSLGAVLPALLASSDNQVAEMLLRSLGAEEEGAGTAAAGLEALRDRLAGWGIGEDAVELRDGSGLSRYNQVTPAALTRLLRRLRQLPDFELFREALPVAAEDGTLRGRLLGTSAAGNLRGKTGSLSSVRALSGYVESADGRTLIYSLLVNGYAGPGEVAEAMEDLLVEQLSLYRGPESPEERGQPEGAEETEETGEPQRPQEPREPEGRQAEGRGQGREPGRTGPSVRGG